MTTLVTGATGNTGRQVVRELVGRGEKVRAVTRDAEAARALLGPEMELFTGTHNVPSTLDEAWHGIDRLHVTVTNGLADVGAELIGKAVDAGVRRITVVWGGGVGPVEQAIENSGVEWTRLEPQEFMSNTLTWLDAIRTDGVVREPYAHPSALVHEADIGAVAAVALLEDGHAGRAYNLTGPQALTPHARLAILSEAAGREITFATITHQQAVERLVATGVSRADADYVIGWYAESSPESYTIDPTVEQVLGRPARTFAQWAAEHGHRFRS
ncbi:MAG: NAD(P)H-binding protein [Nocardia sp.]|nr:NAD(P)H-binding protein [Nocardia sp.]